MTVHQILARMEETALMVWTCLLAHVQPVTQDKNVRPTLTTVHLIPVRMVVHVLMVWIAIPVSAQQATQEKTAKLT
jgi:mRNA deadenylase 3'-5' endonuclease subunit Ccr4